MKVYKENEKQIMILDTYTELKIPKRSIKSFSMKVSLD